MRIVSWNVAHQTKRRRIPEGMLPAIAALAPDVLALNEYVDGPTRTSFVRGVVDLGLRHSVVPTRIGTNNQILIATKEAFEPGDLVGPDMPDGGGQANFCHVRFPATGLEVVGLRAPAYQDRRDLALYWERLLPIVRSVADRPILFIGDLNVDPDGKRVSPGKSGLTALRAEGWAVPVPEGPHSFKSGSRIDHAIVAPALRVAKAMYLPEHGGVVYCGGTGALSDHAPLVVDLQ